MESTTRTEKKIAIAIKEFFLSRSSSSRNRYQYTKNRNFTDKKKIKIGQATAEQIFIDNQGVERSWVKKKIKKIARIVTHEVEPTTGQVERS